MEHGKKDYYTEKQKEEAIEKIIAMAKVITLEGGGDVRFIPDRPPSRRHE